MTSVLFDVPGPRARRRNMTLAIVTVVLVVAVIAFLVWRLSLTNQFSPAKWNVFTYSLVWTTIGEMLLNTLRAFALAAVLSLALAFVLAIGRLSDHAWVRVPVTVITELFRAVPVLVMMMILYYGLPTLGVKVEPFWAVVIALMVYNGSVLAEALRAGIESLPRGQGEAGYAIGLRKSGVMALILLPQAVRAMLPVIIAQLVVTMKDTALGFIITYQELLYYAKLLSSQQGRPALQAALVIGGIYIVMCLILSGIAKWAEIKTRRSPKLKALAADNAAVMHEGTDTELIAAQRGPRDFDQGGSGLGGTR
ncbi:amino acid ABC transporter permease [Microbacterium sp.]|uniref:amino acid ABC transporter permease n=1 Tax=Microbacterium sp. TaxID=51671 RepID=UPI002734BC67|nr:amino acid ABC transporter permease [Microbacterium sp.]MDP3950799.1 amino acid ABC transporter permease [Microbacterium sp.]